MSLNPRYNPEEVIPLPTQQRAPPIVARLGWRGELPLMAEHSYPPKRERQPIRTRSGLAYLGT